MKRLRKKLLIIIMVLLLVGCVQNKSENPDTDNKKKPLKNLNTEDYHRISTLISVDNNSGLIELVYDITFDTLAPKQRIFVMTDGIPAEFSLNGSEMGLYHDMEGNDFSSTRIVLKPSVKDKTTGDSVVITPYLVLMDDSFDFVDYLPVFYLGDILGVSAEAELEEYTESQLVPVDIEFIQKLSSESENQLISASKESPILDIVKKDSFTNRVSINGFKYDGVSDYYLSKIGVGDIFVYPLLNGEFMMKDGQILSYYFPETEAIEEMSYALFELQKYNIKKGDIITLLTWDAKTKNASYSDAKIVVEDE